LDGWRSVRHSYAKNVYNVVAAKMWPQQLPSWRNQIWTWDLVFKLKLFMWLVLEGKTLTWDTLQRRGWIGPGRCSLCIRDAESISHMFVDCLFTHTLWRDLLDHYKIITPWEGRSINNCVEDWIKKEKVFKTFPIIVCWNLWLERNRCIFESLVPTLKRVSILVKSMVDSTCRVDINQVQHRIKKTPELIMDTTCWFDGASQGNGLLSGVGGIIKTSGNSTIRWTLNCGQGTNTRAKLLGLWASLILAQRLNISQLHVLGDSKVILDWSNQSCNINVANLMGWKKKIRELIQYFSFIKFDHIYREENMEVKGKVIGALNSNFLTLIPKAANPTTFVDFRPIALCNLCYKLISKIIVNRIKPILSHFLSNEQLGFLKGRQILDAIGTTQECLHSIKSKNSKALILKLDLKKAFDCIDWDFLRLILTQTGFSHSMIKWIMSCVVSPNLAILINGESSSFFRSGRGLRQGFPLSPLLFILAMEALSLLLKLGQAEGKITGIKVSRTIKILHLLFVDDVLIMTNDSLQEWIEIKEILSTFCCASGLLINWDKSTFHYANLQQQALEQLKGIFPHSFTHLSAGLKYLGYFLKADSYKSADWNWLIAKFEKKIGHWCLEVALSWWSVHSH
jgi:ribonuclease HI